MKFYYYLLAVAILGIASADSISIISETPNTILYNITLNKSYGTGIYSFELNGVYNNNLINYTASYNQCSITNEISCNVAFVIEAGLYNSITVLNNGIALGSIQLPADLNNTAGSGYIVHTTIVGNQGDYVIYTIIAIISILVAGNIIYYFKNKGNLYGNIGNI